MVLVTWLAAASTTYRGVALPQKSISDPRADLDMIFLYRRPILDYWCESGEDLRRHASYAIVRIHEIGHHFGFSDGDMERIEDSDGARPDRLPPIHRRQLEQPAQARPQLWQSLALEPRIVPEPGDRVSARVGNTNYSGRKSRQCGGCFLAVSRQSRGPLRRGAHRGSGRLAYLAAMVMTAFATAPFALTLGNVLCGIGMAAAGFRPIFSGVRRRTPPRDPKKDILVLLCVLHSYVSRPAFVTGIRLRYSGARLTRWRAGHDTG